MDDRTAPTLRLHLDVTEEDHDALLEPPLPAFEPDPEVRRAVEADRYDEQILAALVSP